jgi:hypothetical protein
MKSRTGPWAMALGILAFVTAMQTHAAEQWSGDTRIEQMYPAADGMYFITLYKNTALSTCDGGGRWFIASSSPNYQVLVASLLTAFTAGKQLNLNITVNPPQCAGVVNRFIVKDY